MVVYTFPPVLRSEIVRRLEGLLQEARAGELVGIAFAALYQDNEHDVAAVGDARASPIFTRGLIRELDDQLSGISHSRA